MGSLGDLLGGLGSSLGGLLGGASNEFKKLSVKGLGDFFTKIGSDIEHFPKDIQKAINDTTDEFARLNINFNEFFLELLGFSETTLNEAPTPEEFGKKTALEVAKKYKSKPNSDMSKCPETVKSLLVAIGSMMKIKTGDNPNPYADFLINSGHTVADSACSEA